MHYRGIIWGFVGIISGYILRPPLVQALTIAHLHTLTASRRRTEENVRASNHRNPSEEELGQFPGGVCISWDSAHGQPQRIRVVWYCRKRGDRVPCLS